MEKIKNTYNKINNYVENIKEWKWLIITFFICLIFFISISVQILWQPYIFAEDGTIFIKEALSDGWKSLNNIYGGYMSLVPRIIALIAVWFGKNFNSFYIVTFIMKTLSIIYVVICINYFNINEFKWVIKNRILRLIISLLFISVISNQNFIIYNATYTHWWSGFLIFLVGINILNGKLPKFYIIPIVMLSILTSPSAVLIALPLLYYVCVKLIKIVKEKDIKNIKNINKKEIIKIILIILPLLLQVYAILFKAKYVSGVTSSTILSFDYIFVLIKSILKCFFRNFTNCVSFGLSGNLPRKVDIFIGLFIWAILLYRNIKNKNLKLFIFYNLEMLALLFMAMYKDRDLYLLPYLGQNWYISIHMGAIAFIITKTVYDDFLKNKIMILKILTILLCTIYFVAFYVNTYKPDYSFCDEVYKIESNVNYNSTEIVEVPIAPKGFYAKIPVDMKE